MRYKGKIVWITGASSGIGESLAYEMAKAGATLILSSRKVVGLERVQNNCKKYHPAIHIQPLDLEQHDALSVVAQKVLTQFGKIDILVNNGGISQRSFAKDTIFEVDKRLMDINYLGIIALTKAVLQSMVAKKSGQIVTVSSLTGVFETPYRSAYAATKHALHGFMDSLRAELINDNIMVTIISPGFVKTNVSINAFTGDGSSQNTMDSRQESGMDVTVFAQKMFKAIDKKKKVPYIGGKEVIMVYIKRFMPWLYYRMIAKVNVK